ncbi:MAG: glycosyltransferase family 9 protein, partial [Alphaproteobacteria bacterium]
MTTKAGMAATARQGILVIKLAALGDFILSTGPFAAIRKHHPDVPITLLTTAPFAEMGRATGWFDTVWTDTRPAWWQVGGWLALRRRLRQGGFARVYDLQTSDRSAFYFRLFGSDRPEWSGIAPGCSHPDPDPGRDTRHTIDRQRGQLRAAGILEVPDPDLAWLDADISKFDLPPSYALLVPGGSVHRPEKRWPADHYGALATALADQGLVPLLLGTPGEADILQSIAKAEPRALDLCGRTSIADIGRIARGAAVAVGNDTGPMHVVAASNCPAEVMFSDASDPGLCAPRGEAVAIVQHAQKAKLPVA